MHVGEDESFYRPVNISDNDWRDIVYFQQADGVMLVEGTALAVIKYSELVPHRGHKFPRTDIDPGSIAFGDGILRVAILFLVEQVGRFGCGEESVDRLVPADIVVVVVCRKIDLYREKLVGELELLDDVQERIEACAGSDLRPSEVDGRLIAGREAAQGRPDQLRFILHEIVPVRQPFAGAQLFRVVAS